MRRENRVLVALALMSASACSGVYAHWFVSRPKMAEKQAIIHHLIKVEEEQLLTCLDCEMQLRQARGMAEEATDIAASAGQKILDMEVDMARHTLKERSNCFAYVAALAEYIASIDSLPPKHQRRYRGFRHWLTQAKAEAEKQEQCTWDVNRFPHICDAGTHAFRLAIQYAPMDRGRDVVKMKKYMDDFFKTTRLHSPTDPEYAPRWEACSAAASR